jgi:hypothetical protein
MALGRRLWIGGVIYAGDPGCIPSSFGPQGLFAGKEFPSTGRAAFSRSPAGRWRRCYVPSRRFNGALQAVRRPESGIGLLVTVNEGEIVGLIGPNGAGKTTSVQLDYGLVAPDSGAGEFRGKDVTGLAPHVVARKASQGLPEHPAFQEHERAG